MVYLAAEKGGGLTPEVASRTGNIDFIINHCGAPLSCQETNIFEIENELLTSGFSDIGYSHELHSRDSNGV